MWLLQHIESSVVQTKQEVYRKDLNVVNVEVLRFIAEIACSDVCSTLVLEKYSDQIPVKSESK